MAASVTDFFFFKFLRSNLRASGPREPTGPIAAGEESRIEKKVAFVLGSLPKFPASEVLLGQDKHVCEIVS